jgi:DNA-binding MarR family transcriptional regulator
LGPFSVRFFCRACGRAASSRLPLPCSWPKSKKQVTTPVQCAALAAVSANARIDQVTLAGLIAFDRTTITGVVVRLVQKGLVAGHESSRDRRARELKITDAGRRTLRAASRRQSRRLRRSCCVVLLKRKPKSLCGSCRKPSLPAMTSVELRCATQQQVDQPCSPQKRMFAYAASQARNVTVVKGRLGSKAAGRPV